MEPLYNPDGVESRWQGVWEAEGLYAAGAGASRDESYVICVPPPNVTGDLHLGHALNGSIQDVLVRWHRMRGYRTTLAARLRPRRHRHPERRREAAGRGGSDAARPRPRGVHRANVGMAEQTGRTIMGQYRRLGASLDYSRERFTLR